MNAHPVDLYEPLPVPYLAARPVVGEILEAMSRHERPYERVLLDVDFHDLHLAFPLRASVPIDLAVVASVSTPPEQYDITIRGSDARSAFPTFAGSLKPNPLGAKESELYLTGTYGVPGGPLGEGFDATVMREVAKKSLERFLKWLAAETARRVEADERARNLHRHHV